MAGEDASAVVGRGGALRRAARALPCSGGLVSASGAGIAQIVPARLWEADKSMCKLHVQNKSFLDFRETLPQMTAAATAR